MPSDGSELDIFAADSDTVVSVTVDELRKLYCQGLSRGPVGDYDHQGTTIPERTCHDASDSAWDLECSRCGCEMLGSNAEPALWMDSLAMPPSFCPNCGARVVEE